MQRISLLRLFIFIPFLLLSQDLPKMQIVGNPQLLPSEIVGRRDANGRFCAAIKVVSNLKGLSYDSYNGIVGDVAHKPGVDIVFLSPDERVLEVYHSGHQPLKIILSEIGIRLKPKQMWQIKIKGQAAVGDLLPVTFLIKPVDAVVTVDGKRISGGKPADLSKGKHRLKITREGYRTIEKEIRVDKDHVLFNFTLQEVDLVPVTIKSEPSGADIFMNGVNQGQTDRGLWLYPGAYQLKIQLPGYVVVEKTITVVENQDNAFAFSLLKNAGYLHITVDPPDAAININQQIYRATDKISLPPGTYPLTVFKNGYLEVRDQVDIKIGETVRKTYKLIKNVATLYLDVQPAKAAVLINKTDYSGRKKVELAPGVYKIEVRAKGYYPKSETLTLQRGQEINRSYRLVQRVGKLRFSVAPVFAEVRLKRNGRIIQRWQGLKLIKNLPVGQYEIEASANGYSTERKTVHVLENQTATVDLRLEKGVFFTGGHRNTSITGQLRLTVSPSDARITVDGTPVTDNYLILPVGQYHIECQKSGFVGQSKTVRISQHQETRLEIQLTQKSGGGAFIRSLFFPGWGQSYKENTGRGWFYGLSFLAGAAGAYYFTDRYNKTVKDYNAIRQQYQAAVDYNQVLTLGDQMESQYKKVEDNEKLRNYFYIAAAGIWLINVLDAAFMPPGWEKTDKYAFHFKGNGVQLRVSLH